MLETESEGLHLLSSLGTFEGVARDEPAPDEIWEWGVDHGRDRIVLKSIGEKVAVDDTGDARA